MIRACNDGDILQMIEVINDAARKYRGAIAAETNPAVGQQTMHPMIDRRRRRRRRNMDGAGRQ